MTSPVDGLLAPGREVATVGEGLLSSLPPDTRDAAYDRWPGLYDRLIPNRIYNRLAWTTHPADYVAFAREAAADAEGPMLDAAGGTAAFTAPAYAVSRRRIVLTDLSLGMLTRARRRLPAADHIAFVQADGTDPPFAPGAFATVACLSALHVFGDPGRVVAALRPLVAPGGRLFLSGLVAETRVGSAYLRALERAGEVGPRRSAAELEALVAAATGGPVRMRRLGSMAYLVVEAG